MASAGIPGILQSSVRHPLKFMVLLASYINGGISRKLSLEDGTKLIVSLPDGLSRRLYFGDHFEPDLIAYLEQTLEKGMVVFDVGAHIGYNSAQSSRLVGPSGKIIAFEPTPSSAETLELNAENLGNVTLEEVAITDGASDTVELQDYGVTLACYNTLHQNRIRNISRIFAKPRIRQVPATTIDRYSEEKNLAPDLIKIDVEGGEMNVLKGATETLSRYNPHIIIEGGDRGRSQENSTQACLELIVRLRYKIFEFDEKSRKIEPHEIKQTYPNTVNFLCSPC